MLNSTTDKSQYRRGFTLLEIMVAVSIIAIVFTSVFRLHLQSLNMSQRIRFNSVAALLAQSVLAGYEAKPVDELSDGSGDFGEEFPGYQWEAAVSEVESEILDETAEHLKKLDITVSFQETDRFRLVTYRLMMDRGE